MKMVCYVSNFYPPNAIGGAEIVAHSHAQNLRRRGIDIRAFVGKFDPTLPRYSTQDHHLDGIPIRQIILHAEDYDPTVIENDGVRRSVFEEYLQSLSPDIVHFHNINGLSFDILSVPKNFGIRSAITFHDYWASCYKNTLLKSQSEICRNTAACHECTPYAKIHDSKLPIVLRTDHIGLQLGAVDHLLAPSMHLATFYDDFLEIPGSVRAISNGIDLDKFKQNQKRRSQWPLKLVFAGYLGEHKGPQVLIEAIEILRRLGYGQNHLDVTIAGGGHLENALRRSVADQGLEKIIKFTGKSPHEEIIDLFADSDVLVSCSIWPENEPVTILEAMALGLAVVGPGLGGILELVEHEITGLLYRPGSAEDLATSLSRLVDNPQLATEMGMVGRQRIEPFDLKTSIDQLLSLYEQPRLTRPTFNKVICYGLMDGMAASVIGRIGITAEAGRVRFETSKESSVDLSNLCAFWVCGSEITPKEADILRRTQGIPIIAWQEYAPLLQEMLPHRRLHFYDSEDEAFRILSRLSRIGLASRNNEAHEIN